MDHLTFRRQSGEREGGSNSPAVCFCMLRFDDYWGVAYYCVLFLMAVDQKVSWTMQMVQYSKKDLGTICAILRISTLVIRSSLVR
jgi:hypothetical protein